MPIHIYIFKETKKIENNQCDDLKHEYISNVCVYIYTCMFVLLKLL